LPNADARFVEDTEHEHVVARDAGHHIIISDANEGIAPASPLRM
jgi:hypothetical protein